MGARVHVNVGLKGQRRWGAALAEGIGGDVDVILGPHYAYKQFVGKPNVLMLDRAYWGDPDCATLGWLQPDGSRVFATGDEPRPQPELHPWKEYRGDAVVLGTWEEDCRALVKKARDYFPRVYYRSHPAEPTKTAGALKLQGDIRDVWRICDVAIGTTSTALHEAVFFGLATIGDIGQVASDWDNLRRPDRSAWAHELSYRQFHIDEIWDGTAWQLLNR